MESRSHLGAVGRCGLALVTGAALVLAAGCGKAKPDLVPVKGKVTFEGTPLPWGLVRFQPTDQTGRPGTAYIQADGTYSAETWANVEGLMPGQYSVTVAAEKKMVFPETAEQQAAAAKIGIPTPARYTKPNTSKLTLTVKPGDSAKTYDIQLTK